MAMFASKKLPQDYQFPQVAAQPTFGVQDAGPPVQPQSPVDTGFLGASSQQPVRGGGIFSGFNDAGGTADKLGQLGAFLLSNTDNPNNLSAQQQFARERDAYAQTQDARKRSADFADFTKQWDYQAAHPKPVNNDTTADYDFIGQRLGPQAAQQFLANKTDPIVTIPLPDGRTYVGPKSQAALQMGAGGDPQSGGGGSIPRVTGEADYGKLPAGAQFYDPQGNLRTKGGR